MGRIFWRFELHLQTLAYSTTLITLLSTLSTLLSTLSTLLVHCRWVDEVARKETGHLPLYAEVKKNEGASARLLTLASGPALLFFWLVLCLKRLIYLLHNWLKEKATKWYSEGEIDGLTTNGVLIMHPVSGFASDSKPSLWREVSVDGGIYALRESRSTPQKSSLVSPTSEDCNSAYVCCSMLCSGWWPGGVCKPLAGVVGDDGW